MDENIIVVTDDEGNEYEFELLFTFKSDDTNKSYVLYYDPSFDPSEVYASIYDDEGNLFQIESKEEQDMVDEVFQSFMAENEEG